MDDRVIGVLGGGQLGRMFVEAAHRLNIKVRILDAENAPAKQINATQHVTGSFRDAAGIKELAKQCDILTVEIEHVDTAVLEEITKGEGKHVEVQPSWRTIRVIQDKYVQKHHLAAQGIPTVESIALKSVADGTAEELAGIGEKLGYPFMLKSRKEAYDGRGNFPVTSQGDIPAAQQALSGKGLYAEKWAPFEAELAVMVVKTKEEANVTTWESSTLSYPTVETVHEESICKLVYAPARGVSQEINEKAQILARKAVASLWGKGVFGVEMFLLADESVIINEIAPRPHNSGHYTIEACPVSQYDAHLRAILDLPIPPSGTQMNTQDTHAIMLNLLGGGRKDSHVVVSRQALTTPGATIHLYGKGDARPGRKMGHITVIASSMEEAEEQIQPLIDAVDQVRAERGGQRATDVSKSVAKKIPATKPVVAITMGSDSDLPVLKPGIALLRDLGIPFQVTITSAHRTPGRMFAFAAEAASKGIKVIIAAAGGAAHLPGMVAASTPLPVIGVPVKGSTLDGMDSLLSIVQMPRGVPVATVAINNSINAALLAARILGASDRKLRARLEQYAAEMESGVMQKVETLELGGWEAYGEKR